MYQLLERWVHRPTIREAPRLDPGDASIVLEAWVGEEVVGRIISVRCGLLLVIQDMLVLRAWRGRGIGRTLVRAVFYKSQIQGLQKAYLATSCDEGFWALQGFRPICLEATTDAALLRPYLPARAADPGTIMRKAVPPIMPANPFR